MWILPEDGADPRIQGVRLEKGGREWQDSKDLQLTLSDTDGEGMLY